MRRWMIVAGALLALAVAAFFVVPRVAGAGATTPDPGTVVLSVGGQYRSTMTLPAMINWCPVSRIAAFEAIAADTGFAIAVRESNALTKGPHPVFTVEMAPQAPRPNVTAALRWLRQSDTNVVAYRATSGHVDFDAVGATASGSLLLHLFNAVGNDSLVVQGRFAGVKVVAMAAGCT